MDPHPEEARMYTFELVSVDNGGRLDISNAAGRITVVASNNPHGTVQLAAPLVQQVSENVGNVSTRLSESLLHCFREFCWCVRCELFYKSQTRQIYNSFHLLFPPDTSPYHAL